MGYAPFPIYSDLTAVAVAYKNPELIADQVLPRVPVASSAFDYLVYPAGEAFTIPDTRVGRTSAPNQIEFSATKVPGSTVNYALDSPVPNEDIENAKTIGYNPLARATQQVADLIALDREVRVATKVFDPNQYATANKQTLSGTGQWSDFTNSDPVSAILAQLDNMVMRANVGVVGQLVATKLKTHPKIIQAFYGNSASYGVVPLQFIAELLGLQKILVGQGFVNTAKPGQTQTLARAWGKHAAFLRIDPQADTGNGVTFGLTAQWGQRVAGAIDDPDIGMRGGQRVRVGESVQEVITANDLGVLFQNAIA